MPTIKRVLLISFISILLLLFGIAITFIMLGRSFLVIEEKINPSEAIIVLSGDDGRLEYGADLYEPGQRVILTNATEPNTTRSLAIELGIQADDIVEENEATSTYTNATLSRDIMNEQQLSSAIVVTSNYHTRRTRMTFNKIYESTDIDLSYAVAPSSFSTTGSMTRYEHRIAFSEYAKLTGYWLRLFLF
ncbi:YdcF family protein [Halobacillus locisalis]|uniref:YdcF family protein n=1 Tax=Halobacillus locisalis TaxID=220753 RepID=A0A838CTJ5_9BACI|nr:YdcF family protein [Halobacillus locisalis]MBA2175472.1 YdcF family protein [Halobacillus locisalis]